jgi:uncharacterized protein YabN with tetrapyrrole methylase and pyrophosphatase domain
VTDLENFDRLVGLISRLRKECPWDREQTIESLSELMDKMVRRHPHVFGDKKAETAEEAVRMFYEAKRKERKI